MAIHYILTVKLVHFSGLPGRNNLPAAVNNISPAYQIVKCHRGERNNLFIIHCSRIDYVEWHQLFAATTADQKMSTPGTLYEKTPQRFFNP
jgi:hypothetical protein